MTGLARAVSVVIPCWNEAGRVLPTLEAVQAWCRAQLDDHELLVVDDGSRDGTADAVRSHFGDAVELVRLEHNRGKGHAIRQGVFRARLPAVLLLDADHSIPIDHLAEFLPHAAADTLVIGSRRVPGAQVECSRLRRAAGRASQTVIRLCAMSGVRDTQCGFKLLPTAAARALLAHQRIERFGYDFELLFLARRAGLRIVELPVRFVDRGDGRVRTTSYLRTFAELLRFALPRHRYPPRGGFGAGAP